MSSIQQPTQPESAFALKMARGLSVAQPAEAPDEDGRTEQVQPAAAVVVVPKAQKAAPAPAADAAPMFAEADGGKLSATQSFKIDPGKAKVALTSRVPKSLHGRLKIALLALQLNASDGRRVTIDDFVEEAIEEKLKRTKVA